MPDKVTFVVSPRSVVGKQVKQLRRDGIVPANVYGAGLDSMVLQCSTSEFRRLYDRAGETTVVYLTVAGDSQEKPVLIDEVTVDPISGALVHVSFKQVNLKEKIEAEVPVETTGEFKVSGAVLVVVKDTVVVEALPTDLPEKFEVDVSTLTEIGQSITFADLAYDKSKVRLVEIETDEDLHEPIVMAQEQREEEEVEETTPQEVEITGEKPAEQAPEATDKKE